MGVKRSKNFATLVYLDSSSIVSVRQALRAMHVSYLISPCHSSDLLEDGSGFKKAHYHIILVFDSLKSIPQVKSILTFKDIEHDYDLSMLDFDMNSVNFVGLEIVNSLTVYARYLCHLDNPEKASYSVGAVESYGLDYSSLIRKERDKYDACARVVDFIVSNNCTSFASVLLYARQNDFEMFRVLCDNSFTIREFVKSYSLSLCSSDGLDSNVETLK